MRWVIVAAGLFALAGCGDTPRQAAYREAGEAEKRLFDATKAGDDARACTEANKRADALLRAESKDYESAAALARLHCSRL